MIDKQAHILTSLRVSESTKCPLYPPTCVSEEVWCGGTAGRTAVILAVHVTQEDPASVQRSQHM